LLRLSRKMMDYWKGGYKDDDEYWSYAQEFKDNHPPMDGDKLDNMDYAAMYAEAEQLEDRQSEVVYVQVKSEKMPSALPYAPAEYLVAQAVKIDTQGILQCDETQVMPGDVYAYLASGCHLGKGEDAYLAKRKLPPGDVRMPLTTTDGQAKIMLDFILGMDQMASMRRYGRKDVRVLVVGSTAESGIAGLTYRVMSAMGFTGEIDLYDPFEIEAQYLLEGVQYRHHREYYTYQTLDKYDIVFDDSYDMKSPEAPTKHRPIFAHRVKFYSLKHIPGLSLQDGCLYKQVYETDAKEARSVSHPRVYINAYKRYDIGRCRACLELELMLHEDLSEQARLLWHAAHKVPCNGHPRECRTIAATCSYVRQDEEADAYIYICDVHKRDVPLYRIRALSPNRDYRSAERGGHRSDLRVRVTRDIVLLTSREILYHPSLVIETGQEVFVTQKMVDEIRDPCVRDERKIHRRVFHVAWRSSCGRELFQLTTTADHIMDDSCPCQRCVLRQSQERHMDIALEQFIRPVRDREQWVEPPRFREVQASESGYDRNTSRGVPANKKKKKKGRKK
jgi:hypothetical protein